MTSRLVARRAARWLLAPLTLLLLMPAAPALAIQGIGVSPTSQTVELAPGASTSGTLTAINDGDTDVSYHVYATDYAVKNEDYVGVFTTGGGSKDTSAATWFTLPTGAFTVRGHEEATVAYTLTVPKTAAIGGHYATVFIETIPPTGQQGTYISRIQRLGSIFYITVNGALNISGSIASYSASILQTTTPIHADLRIQNNGNVHFIAEGTTQLSTLFGKSGKPASFHGEVLPGTTRHFAISMPSGPIGIYHVVTTVKYAGQTTTLGRYVIEIPLITLLVALISLAVLITVTVLWLRDRRKRRQPKSE